ncbi:hypothetical protein ILUMI_04649 [Ignelater luminosus]|uniref:Uncharacterized protein n=1 Tax=Ignelater luminosus TaxID=2038154 RepID=A0A8K0GKX6_IGNLU|nr:hypothetical protein ILUMI_04649 [Ignelater luminosus]
MLFKSSFSISLLRFSDDLPYPYPEEHQLFLIDLACEGWEAILKKAEEYRFFRHPFRWLVIKNNYTNLDYLESLEITIDSQFFIAEKNEGVIYLETAYKITAEWGLLWMDIGRWVKDNGFEYFNELIISRNRSDLMGVTINTTMVLADKNSINHMLDYVDIEVDFISKANYIYIHHLMNMINATGGLILTDTWGVLDPETGMFTGMIGDLQRELAEIGGIVSFVTAQRLPVVDYVSPTTPTIARFIFRAPPLSYVSNIFTLPFEYMVWICFFLLTIFTALVIYIIVYFEWKNPKYLQEEDPQQVTRLRANFFDSLMVQIGGICQQGSDTEPRSMAGRTALIFSFVALMFLYTSFSANIVALLQTSSDSIKTLQDLLYSNIRLGVEGTPYSRYIFSHETEPIRKALYEEKIAIKGQPPNFLTAEIGVARLRQEFFAFHCEVGTCYKIISDTFLEHEKCGLTEVAFFQAAEPWLPMRKNSTYSEILKVGFRKIQERGVRHREIVRFFTKKPACSGQGSTFVSVGLIDCYFGFFIFGIGVACAIALLVLEILAEKYNIMIILRARLNALFFRRRP